ncbi:HIT domain-containing protein [uncultured Devosia sp.]|uniref:HIT family protein n=1 Tax=uncultured Devosia sp. TaxID=211434 RepID=UPI002621EE83|nr:HIT domain-containing protein [uncultured Devosia sp.]
MVIPKRHSASPFEMNTDEWSDLPLALAAARESLEQFSPAGFTLGWNVGPAAGQTVGHTHLHVIARFEDDPMAGRGIRHPLKRPGQGKPA